MLAAVKWSPRQLQAGRFSALTRKRLRRCGGQYIQARTPAIKYHGAPRAMIQPSLTAHPRWHPFTMYASDSIAAQAFANAPFKRGRGPIRWTALPKNRAVFLKYSFRNIIT
jgi:hypothetical protein